jgi:hypothetical protein
VVLCSLSGSSAGRSMHQACLQGALTKVTATDASAKSEHLRSGAFRRCSPTGISLLGLGVVASARCGLRGRVLSTRMEMARYSVGPFAGWSARLGISQKPLSTQLHTCCGGLLPSKGYSSNTGQNRTRRHLNQPQLLMGSYTCQPLRDALCSALAISCYKRLTRAGSRAGR